MRNYWKIILFGFPVWLVPFIVSIFIYPLKTGNNPLFENIMPVIISIVTALFAVIYLRKINTGYLRAGIILGVS